MVSLNVSQLSNFSNDTLCLCGGWCARELWVFANICSTCSLWSPLCIMPQRPVSCELLILSAGAQYPGLDLMSPWKHVSLLDFRPVGCPGASALWWVQESSWTHCHIAFFLVSLEWCSFQLSLSTNQSMLTLNEFSSWINVSPTGADTLEVEKSIFPKFPNCFWQLASVYVADEGTLYLHYSLPFHINF